FEERCNIMKNHYETEPWRIRRENIWNGMDLTLLLRQNPGQTLSEKFEWLNTETRRVQRGLANHQGNFSLRQ
ncbi:Bgt-20365-2, partial [Blumeria graminis f. sp. tritici]